MNPVKTSVVLVALLASAAHAETRVERLALAGFDRSWPALPAEQGPGFGEVVAHKVVDASNKFLATHVDRLSLDLVNLRIDGDRKAAKLGVGAGTRKWLAMRVAGDIEMVDDGADVNARFSLAAFGKQLDVKLPTISVGGAEYKGERGVELRLPLLRKKF